MTAMYRADQIGSLLRPPALLEARAAFTAGRISADQLRQAEDTAIMQALAMQQATGIDVYSDGEYRRAGWAAGLPSAVEGYVPVPADAAPAAAGAAATAGAWHGEHVDRLHRAMGSTPAMAIGERLRVVRRITGDESAFLKHHAPGPFKITMASASWHARNYRPGITDHAYATREDLLDHLVEIVREEIQALVAEGVPYIQIDSLRYVFDFTDDEKRQQWLDAGVDPDRGIAACIAADNAILAGVPRDGVTIGLHMCRGNNQSNWFAQGGYDRVAEQAFSQLQYDRLLLEYDDERSGDFEPLRHVRPGVTVVLGLVSTKTPVMESADDLLRRIDAASKYVPLANLALSPQCGFASMAPGNVLSWDDQRRELELVVDTARKVWG